MNEYKDVTNQEIAIEDLKHHFCSYNARQLERLIGSIYETLYGRMAGMLRPTDVGKLLNPSISAMETNLLLKECGLQEQVDGCVPYGDDKPRKDWKLTDYGKLYGEEFHLGTKRFPNQASCQIRWNETVVELLQLYVDE